MIDCCDASFISESEAISSSSRTADPLTKFATTVPDTLRVSVDNSIRSLSSVVPIDPLLITIVLSNRIEAPSSGSILMPPEVVWILILESPAIISSAIIAEGIPHSPEPSPSDIQDSPEDPCEVIPYSTLLAERIPSSTKSVKFESNC